MIIVKVIILKRRFVAINHNRKRLIIILIVVVMGVITCIFSIKWLFNIVRSIFSSEEEQLYLLNYGLSNVKVIDLNLIDPNDILSVSLYMKKNQPSKLEITTNNSISDSPLVYIYNTHDEESYKDSNVNYASKVLKSELYEYGIPSYVENKKVSEYMNGSDIKNAFTISRNFIDEYWREHETLKYFIDIHRSNASREITNVTIGNDNYAKILFVVSMENKFYEESLEFADVINSMLDSRLSRGIMKKTDENNYYNQDMDAKCLLIELGGYESTKEEVDNTLKLFAEILYEYMSEGYYGN